MKKKYIIIMCLSIFTIILSGCSDRKGTAAVDINNETDDSQPYWNIYNHPVAKGESGYYYIVQGEEMDMSNWYIMYFDPSSEKAIKLCSKPSCSHVGEECNAFLGNSNQHQPISIWYYNGFLYVIRQDPKNGVNILEQISKDGNYRKDICQIGNFSIGDTYLRLVFHDNYVYVYPEGIQGTSYGKEFTQYITRSPLKEGSKEMEQVISVTGKNVMFTSVRCYGDKLFYITESQETSMQNNIPTTSIQSNGLFVYDTKTGQTSQVLKEPVTDYTIDVRENSLYYYVYNDGLYQIKLNGKGSAKKLFTADNDSTICHLSFDGNYLYQVNSITASYQLRNSIEQYLWIRDPKGKEVNKIRIGGINPVYFGDKDYIFSTSNEEGKMSYIKKSEITTAKDWTILKEMKQSN